MFRKRTVFVVGAGASRELGLPTGAELSQQISEMCAVAINGFGQGANAKSQKILNDFNKWSGSDTTRMTRWLSAMEEIRDALPFKDSIDAVIDQHYDRPEVAEAGKYMIARLIMKAETGSHLGPPFGERGTTNLVVPTWLHTFVRMLFEGLRKDNLARIGDNISVVCFNYDRCIERYLSYAIATAYSLDEDEAIELAARVKIVHAYGSLGSLPGWQTTSSRPSVAFGATSFVPWEVAANLKTFSESVDGDTDDAIKALIQGAQQYVYLGLSYGRQNMELMTTAHPGRTSAGLRPVYASGKGQYEQGLATIGHSICRTYSDTIYNYARPPTGTWIELGKTAKERGGSVCLNSYWGIAKWISALVMPLPGLATAH